MITVIGHRQKWTDLGMAVAQWYDYCAVRALVAICPDDQPNDLSGDLFAVGHLAMDDNCGSVCCSLVPTLVCL